MFVSEQRRDKHIVRDDEFSDSEDEGDEPVRPGTRRKNEHSYRDTKRPRLMEETSAKGGSAPASSAQSNKPPAVSTSGGGALSSPLPPEPSPITPLPQEEGVPNTASKSKSAIIIIIIICMHTCTFSPNSSYTYTLVQF